MKLLCPYFLNTELESQEILHRKRKNLGVLENVYKSSLLIKTWNWQYKLITPGYWLLPYLFVSTQSCPSVLQILYLVKYFLILPDWPLIAALEILGYLKNFNSMSVLDET